MTNIRYDQVGASLMFLQKMSYYPNLLIPKVGKAEKLKLQEAIPPFSLIEDSIHGKKAEMLVKMEKSCWLQLSPSLLLTIPTRIWAPSSFVIVSGPPLSP